MAKLEIRDLNHEVEIKKHELAEIKGGFLFFRRPVFKTGVWSVDNPKYTCDWPEEFIKSIWF